MSENVLVGSYGDIARRPKLSGRDVDAVATLLLEHGLKTDWLIARVDSSMLAEKQREHGIEPAKGSDQIIHGRVTRTTEKAVQVAIGRDEIWFPKSTLTVFKRASDAEIRVPQRGLGEFSDGERAEMTPIATGFWTLLVAVVLLSTFAVLCGVVL